MSISCTPTSPPLSSRIVAAMSSAARLARLRSARRSSRLTELSSIRRSPRLLVGDEDEQMVPGAAADALEAVHAPHVPQLRGILALLPARAQQAANPGAPLCGDQPGRRAGAARGSDRALVAAPRASGRRLRFRLGRPFHRREEPAGDLHLPAVVAGGGLADVVAVADRAAWSRARQGRSRPGLNGAVRGA